MQTPVGFLSSELDPGLIVGGIDDAFARFAAEMLASDYPGIHRFPTSGKDGGIDFVASLGTSRVVGDFKYLSGTEVVHAQKAWRVVKDRLQRNLSGSTPPVGQSQYDPWFDAERPICEYCFVVSTRVKNLSLSDLLEAEIASFFVDLAGTSHFTHLAQLRVRLIDWSDFHSRLVSQPNALLRWFPRTRPLGMVPLGDGTAPDSFRGYLRSDRLSFYSRAQHRDNNPTIISAGIPDEATLLAQLDFGHVTGLLITGAGGYGKTRLSLEIARLAEKKGWLVLRIVGRISAEKVVELGTRLSPEQSTLMVVDYVETQPGFDDFVDSVNALNDSFGLRVGYVASCRSSYYSSISALPRHLRIDVSPPAGAHNDEWERRYRIATVSYILERGGLGGEENAIHICRDLPVLAVFLLYLHERNRKPELEALLREQDFGQWVARRVQASFGMASVTRQLATVSALLPFSQATAAQLTPLEREVLDRLATDGWVEEEESGGGRQWLAAHDVLVDRVVIAYLDTIRATIALFLDEVLTSAERVGATRSVLAAMQRIGPEPVLSAVSWISSIARCLERAPEAWEVVRPELLATPLLNVVDSLSLLRDHDGFWSGAECDVDFQNRIGWICRSVVKHTIEGVPRELFAILVSWTARAAREARNSNFVLTWGLRLAPAELEDAALSWLSKHRSVVQGQHLIVSWLKSGLSHSSMRPFVKAWLAQHHLRHDAQFVFHAWLGATGETDVVRAPIVAWLEQHQLALEASFVYRAWLAATGEIEVVRAPIVAWLAQHQLALDARFVVNAWLDAAGDPEVVRAPILTWLAQHQLALEASFVYRTWLAAAGELEVMRAPIVAWLAKHQLTLDAQFVFNSWLDAKGEPEVVRASIVTWLAQHQLAPEASFVYRAWLAATGELEVVHSPIVAWLAQHQLALDAPFVFNAWLDATGEPEVVRAPIITWLAQHQMTVEASFVYCSWLDATGEPEVVRAPIITWLTQHQMTDEARFVFRSWLAATGELEVVLAPIDAWLAQHQLALGAPFVFNAWLDASGELEVVREPVIVWLAQHQLALDAQFVFHAWLGATGETDVVRAPIVAWLEQHQLALEASFVYRAWLAATGEIEVVRAPIVAWLAQHQLALDARFVVNAWLDAAGDPEVVRAPILTWLAQHQLALEASFVYRTWLAAAGELEVMRAPIVAWLAQHQLTLDAQFVFNSWLDATGEPEIVRTPMITWLTQHQLRVDASFVYRAWLDATSEPEVVREPIIAWLAQHQLALDAQFVYRAWLDATSEPEVVREPIIAWLAQHQLALDAQFVYRAWLDATGEPEGVRASIIAWIGIHPNAPGGDHLYRAWLQGGGEWQVVAAQALAWLRQHREAWEATHLLKFIAKQSNLPEDAVGDVLHWCREFSTDEDALWRLSTLLHYNEIQPGLFEDLIVAAEEVLTPRIAEGRPDSTECSQISFVLSTIASLALNTPRLLSKLARLIVRWLRNPESYGLGAPPLAREQQPELVARIVVLLGIGRLDARSDAEALDRFAEWLTLWDGEHQNWARSELARARRP